MKKCSIVFLIIFSYGGYNGWIALLLHHISLLAAVLDEKYLEHTVLVIGAHAVYVLLVYMYGLHCCW